MPATGSTRSSSSSSSTSSSSDAADDTAVLLPPPFDDPPPFPVVNSWGEAAEVARALMAGPPRVLDDMQRAALRWWQRHKSATVDVVARELRELRRIVGGARPGIQGGSRVGPALVSGTGVRKHAPRGAAVSSSPIQGEQQQQQQQFRMVFWESDGMYHVHG